MTIRSVGAALGAALLTLAIATPAASQQQSPGSGKAAAPGPADEFDRGVPRSAMRGYLVACREADYERAAAYLDLRRLPPAERAREGAQLARHLKVVLDRKLWVDLEALSDQPGANLDDGVPARRELVGRIDTHSGPADILLQRVPREKDGVHIWKISAATVARIPGLYAEFGYGPLGEVLPGVLFEVRLFEVELWQWAGLLLMAALAGLLGWPLASALLRLARTLAARTRTELDDRLLSAAVGPLRLGLFLVLFSAGSALLGLSVPVQRVLARLEVLAAIVAVAWFLFRAVDLAADLTANRLLARGQTSATGFVPLGRGTLKVALMVLAGLATLDTLGFNVTALIAGLGVAGLAFALAAQKSLENLFGGVTLLADQPVKVGDFCRFSDKIGTVEEIGLRATRVRTLDRTVVSIPNAEFSTLQIENFAKRDMIRLYTILGLRYETTPEQLRYVLAELRSMLLAHPRVTPDPARVRFVAFGAYSLDLEVFAFANTSDWNEFLPIREDIFLRIMDIVERAGTGFAFPSHTTYVGRDDGLDAQKVCAAEAQVEAWRREGRLPFPDFEPEEKAKMKDTAAYPPEGSALGTKS